MNLNEWNLTQMTMAVVEMSAHCRELAPSSLGKPRRGSEAVEV